MILTFQISRITQTLVFVTPIILSSGPVLLTDSLLIGTLIPASNVFSAFPIFSAETTLIFSSVLVIRISSSCHHIPTIPMSVTSIIPLMVIPVTAFSCIRP